MAPRKCSVHAVESFSQRYPASREGFEFRTSTEAHFTVEIYFKYLPIHFFFNWPRGESVCFTRHPKDKDQHPRYPPAFFIRCQPSLPETLPV